MKQICFTLLACVCLQGLYAQKIIEKHIDFSQGQFVSVNIQIADSIRIITWNKNEVYVKASVDINDDKYDSLYNFTFDGTGNSISIKAKFADHMPPRIYNHDTCCCNYTSKIYCDVYVPESARFSVETIDGNITISGRTEEVKAHSISGFIDMAMASERGADLRLKTITGTIYSNLAIAAEKHGHSSTSDISDAYNGGGKPVDLETISGDIFLRKAE